MVVTMHIRRKCIVTVANNRGSLRQHSNMVIRPLTAKLQEKANKELNEVPARILEDLTDIEKWLAKQPHLNIRTDHQWLLAFLRNTKFSLQRAKEKLDFFYTMKTITPEYFSNKDPLLPEIQNILRGSAVVPITKISAEEGLPTLILIKWANADPKKMTFVNLFKAALMCIDILLKEDDNFSVSGQYILHDMKGFSLSYATQLTPSLCKKAVMSIQHTYPSRIKGIYFVNTPAIYETFINMFRPFFSEKIKNRLKIFREEDFDKVHKEIPRCVFPKEYGGNAGDLHDIAADWATVMENHKDWFVEDARYGSDETKRPGKPKTSADIFGVEGSFRKLSID